MVFHKARYWDLCFFLIFINDLPTEIQECMTDIYADDTTLSTSGTPNDQVQVQERLQKDVDNMKTWSEKNHMVLNPTKTKTMLVTGKRLSKKVPSTELKVYIDREQIQQVSTQKLLGLIIDKEMSFNEHVDKLSTKLAQKIGVLRKIRRCLPIRERMLYYNCMIKPNMMYGGTIWSSCSSEKLQRIFRLQKRAARTILNADKTARSVDLFSKLGWIPFFDEIKINKCKLIYKRLNDFTPSYIEQLLTRNSDIHVRQTRHGKTNLVCPWYKRETEGGRSFTVSSVKLWNSLPNSIKKSESFNRFNKAIRSYFLTKYEHIDNFETLIFNT